MPVSTQQIRNGETVTQIPCWSWWHLSKMSHAMNVEQGKDPNEGGFFPQSSYEFQADHHFEEEEYLVFTDGEFGKKAIVDIKAGDIYKAWR